MKYLFFILIGLFAFQAVHSQLPDDTTASFDISTQGDNEAQHEDQEEENSNIKNATAADFESGEEELEVDDQGNVRQNLQKFLQNELNKRVLDFVVQWQIASNKEYNFIKRNPTNWALDKVNYISYDKNQDVYRFNVRVKDFFSNYEGNFFTGHSVVQFSGTAGVHTVNILRSKYGFGLEETGPLNPSLQEEANSGWSEMSPEDAQADSNVKAMLDIAVESSIVAAVPRVLPNGDWNFDSLTAVYIKTKNDGKYYHFNLVWAGPNGFSAKGDVTVKEANDGSQFFWGAAFDGLFAPTN